MINRPGAPFGCGMRALAAWLLLAALVACGGGQSAGPGTPAPQASTPQRGGTVVFGSISDVDSWNEYLSRQAFAVDVLRRVYLRLARPLGDTKEHPPTYEPVLAESWATSENGTVLTFRLREATWSDGRPLTADDVIFTWKAQTSPEVAWVGADGKQHILDVRKGADERSVVFRFDRPYPDQLADAVDGGILPQHIFGQVPFAEWRTHDWSKTRVGSGPFLPERHDTGQELALVRNPKYFEKDLPRVDRVVIRIVPDASNLVTQLLAGGIDFMDGIPPREAARVAAGAGMTLLPYDEPKYDYLGWNGAKPPFNDPRLRVALTLAIDRQALVDDLLYGYGRVSVGPVLSFWWGADREQTPWPYDPAEATRRLGELGYKPGPGGKLVKHGKPLAFELTTNAGNRLREAALVKIQEQLARIGVQVTTTPLEMKTFMGKNMAGQYDAYVGGWRFTGKIDLESIFHSSQVPDQGNNVVHYRSADLDGELERLETAKSWQEMTGTLKSIQRRIHDDAPYTFLYETQRIAAAGPRLRGATIDVPSDPLARLESWWIEP